LMGDGGTGADIDMSKIFIREPGMNSFEIMLSESQERMTFIVKPEGLEEVLNVFRKFEMAHAVLGRTDDSRILKVNDRNNLVVNLPATALSDAPPIEREERRPSYLDKLLGQKTPKPSLELDEIIYKLIASENICSKEWVYRQYDHEVGVRSIVKCGEGDSGVLRVIGTNKFIAASVGVNSKHCYLDPYHGAKGGLVEVCSNVIASGATPRAMVNCCNFGNPEKPESYWFFSQAVQGMADFCKNMRIPVVGGNVSFYNEDEVTNTAIKASPVMMIVGIIEGEENIVSMPFKNADNHILLIGETKAELGGSEYHSVIYDLEGGTPPKVEEKQVKATWDFLFELYENNLVKANHDINKGGLIITVAEMCFKNNLGAELNFKGCYNEKLRDDEFLFSESVGRFIIEVDSNDSEKIMEIAKRFKIEVKNIGVLNSESTISVKGLTEKDVILDVKKMKESYDTTIPNLMEI
ncbi:MAG: AIR synthase-related protein, partial [Promethearchaeota archaeon]